MSYGANKYKSTSITTATPEQVLLMLYESAIKSGKLAKVALEKGMIAEKCKHIMKVHDIVSELKNTLDHAKGPKVAEQLDGLYDYCISQLLKANVENSVTALDSVVKVLTTLYEGWVAAVDDIKKKKAGVKT